LKGSTSMIAESLRVTTGATPIPPDEIEIISPLEPAEVVANLRARGKEWRESAVPKDLRKFKVRSLYVRISDLKFDLGWSGNVSPIHNPICFGTLEPIANGTRITARFGRELRPLLPMFLFIAISSIDVAINPRPGPSILLGVFVILLLSMLVRRKNVERLRDRLIDVIAAAAQPPVARESPVFGRMSTNGP
jgi:hypothetical protein